MGNLLYGKWAYIAFILIFLINILRIVKIPEYAFPRIYKKMTDEEKKIYDISKIRYVKILFSLAMIILTIFAFIFSEVFPDIINQNVFLISYLIALVIIFFLDTKWMLNWFYKKK